jgi:hypothetical protein
MEVTIDKNTGLPELPEGHFWRIVDRHETIYPVKLQLRRKTWYGSTVVATDISGSHPEYVLATAESLFSLVEARLSQKARVKALVGDYPPKKLEA